AAAASPVSAVAAPELDLDRAVTDASAQPDRRRIGRRVADDEKRFHAAGPPRAPTIPSGGQYRTPALAGGSTFRVRAARRRIPVVDRCALLPRRHDGAVPTRSPQTIGWM